MRELGVRESCRKSYRRPTFLPTRLTLGPSSYHAIIPYFCWHFAPHWAMLDCCPQGAGERANTPTLDQFTSSIGDRADGLWRAHSPPAGRPRVAGEEQHESHPHVPWRRGSGRAGGGRLRVRRVRAWALAGHPSYSANLSVNATIRKQQLICDPAGSVYSGSMSTLYQPGLVSFDNIGAVPGSRPRTRISK